MDIEKIFRNTNTQSYRLYIIAEVGVNHECNMDIAKKLINDAVEGGADAVKFQTYKASSLLLKTHLHIGIQQRKKHSVNIYYFKSTINFGKKNLLNKKYCDELSIEFMSTPFDIESANFLNDLMKVFKISSSDITNKPFIEHLCKFNKPIILSTDASNIDEISDALSWINLQS